MSWIPARGDYFDRARSVAVALMIAAAMVAVIGSTLEWATISNAPDLVEGADFGDQPIEKPNTTAFTGLDAGDGIWVIVAGVVLLIAGVMLIARRRSAWAWLGLVASVVIGAIAFADYRGIEDVARALDRSGDADPALGLLLVAAGGLVGMIASVGGIAATPTVRDAT